MRLFALVSPILFLVITIVLGFLTPGYDHLRHTISRLAIEKFGWIQALNLLQFASGMYLSGLQVSKTMTGFAAKKFVRNAFFFCGLMLLLAALTPTDRIEDIRFEWSLLTPLGIAHYSVIFLFLVFAPFGIRQLSRFISDEPSYHALGRVTLYMGFTAFIASICWFVFYASGLFLGFRGLFQKAILLQAIAWIMMVNFRAYYLTRTKSP